nr:formin-like protein 16 isoform X3 [Lolium perenne]
MAPRKRAAAAAPASKKPPPSQPSQPAKFSIRHFFERQSQAAPSQIARRQKPDASPDPMPPPPPPPPLPLPEEVSPEVTKTLAPKRVKFSPGMEQRGAALGRRWRSSDGRLFRWRWVKLVVGAGRPVPVALPQPCTTGVRRNQPDTLRFLLPRFISHVSLGYRFMARLILDSKRWERRMLVKMTFQNRSKVHCWSSLLRGVLHIPLLDRSEVALSILLLGALR